MSNLLFYLLIFIIPLAFHPKLYNVFELCKQTTFRFFILIIFLLFILKIIKNGYISLKKSCLNFPVFLFLFFYTISTLTSFNFIISLNELYSIFVFVIFYFLLFQQIENEFQIKRILQIVLFSSLFVSFYAILQHNGIDFVAWEEGFGVHLRSTSTLGNPDYVSGYLSMIMPIAFCFLIYSENKILYSLYIVITYLAMLFTYARGGWISAIFGLFIFFLIVDKEKIKENKFSLLFTFLLIFSLTYFISKEKVIIDKKEFNIVSRATSGFNLRYPSIMIRRFLFHDSLFMIRNKPFFGFGPDTFTLVFPKFRSKELSSLAGRNNLPENAHNEYLQIGVTLGLFGLFSFIFILVLAIKCSFILKQNKEFSFILSGIIASLFSFIFQSLFYYKTTSTSLLFFLSLSIISGINYLSFKSSYSINFSLHNITKSIIYLNLIVLTFILSWQVFRPFIADLHYREGVALNNEKKFIDAIREYRIAQFLQPHNKLYSLTIGSTYEQLSHILPHSKKISSQKEELIKTAIKEYEKTVNITPSDGYAYASLGRIYNFYGKIDKSKIKKSIEYYEKAIKMDENNCVFYNDLGTVYLGIKNYESAKKYFEKASSLDPTFSMALSNLGVIYYKKKNYKKSIEYFKLATEKEPDFLPPFVQLGIIYFEQKKFKEASFYLKKANVLNPKDLSIERLLKEAKKRCKK